MPCSAWRVILKERWRFALAQDRGAWADSGERNQRLDRDLRCIQSLPKRPQKKAKKFGFPPRLLARFVRLE